MSTNYTTKTASFKATTANIRNLDATEIKVWSGNGTNKTDHVNILDLIKNSNIIYDDRGGNITDNDIWPNPITLENASIVTDNNGNISINHSTKPYNTFDYSEMTDAQKNITKTAAKVIDNKVYDADGQLLMNWETAAFTNSGNSIINNIFNQYQNITKWNSDLSSLTNGNSMFYGCSSLQSFNGDLSNLTNGCSMLYSTALASFDGNLSSLTDGLDMFSCCGIVSFNGDLSSLTNGCGMFFGCSSLQSFNGDLSSLTDGDSMFYHTALQSFNSDLSSLTNGNSMFFGCSSLQSFNGDLSSLTNGSEMFAYTAFQSFNSDLSSLTNGEEMFYNSSLESFSGDLSSLTNGTNMFDSCKLNAESVHNILHTINPNEKTGEDEGTILIGTNIINDSTTLEAQKLDFAKECLCDSWDELNAEFTAKHWTVNWQFNGTATSTASTLALTDSNVSTALWTKLIEVTDENKHYKYVLEGDGRHFNIEWFHETNGSTEEYDYFGSLLEACGAYGVIPKEYAESNN